MMERIGSRWPPMMQVGGATSDPGVVRNLLVGVHRMHESSGHNTIPKKLLGSRLLRILAATLLSCTTLRCIAAEQAFDVDRQRSPMNATELGAASQTGATGAIPQRWICPNGTAVNVEWSSPHVIVLRCATLKEFIGEFNRYATWHFTYSGPDSGKTVLGVFYPNHPGAEEELLAVLKAEFGVRVQKRIRESQTISLKPLWRTEKAAPRRPAPRSLNIDRDWDGGVHGRQDCEDIQFDDGRGGIWCRGSTLGRMLNSFSRHNQWQLSLVDASISEYGADALLAYDDLEGLLRYLKTYKVVVGSRTNALHQIRLVRSAYD